PPRRSLDLHGGLRGGEGQRRLRRGDVARFALLRRGAPRRAFHFCGKTCLKARTATLSYTPARKNGSAWISASASSREAQSTTMMAPVLGPSASFFSGPPNTICFNLACRKS